MDTEGLLPAVDGRAAYRALHSRVECWLPAMRMLCARHGLPAHQLERLNDGTNVVFAVEDHLIKLYPPYWGRLAAAERAAAERVYGALPIATPEVQAAGMLEGWPYLVMGRLRGRVLSAVWAGLDERDRGRIAGDLGEVLARVHNVSTAGLPGLEADWPRFVRERVSGCVARQREQGVTEAWLAQMPAFLERAAPLYPPAFPPAIVSGDVHDGHLMVEARGGRWQLCGLFDFDDARLGFREYDLAATGLIMMSGRPTLLRTFLHAYGYPREALDLALSRRLLVYTLLHRYRMMTWFMEEFVAGTPTTLDDVATAIYGLD